MTIRKWKLLKPLYGFILILFWTGIPVMAASHDPEKVPPQKITALYIYNFLLFVDWPEKALSDTNTLNLAIYGDPALYEAMYPMAGKKIRGKKLAVYSVTKPEALNDSHHALFVGSDDPKMVREFLKGASGRPVLTLSDRPGFSRLGGMVFFKGPGGGKSDSKNRKRFTINLFEVDKSRLKIRSRLLRMSDVYESKQGLR